MKVGDKLYWLVCWQGFDCRYVLRTGTIIKINRKTVELWGRDFKVSKSDIGYEFFTSKKRLYQYYLKKYREYIRPTLKAIKFLEKRLENEKI